MVFIQQKSGLLTRLVKRSSWIFLKMKRKSGVRVQVSLMASRFYRWETNLQLSRIHHYGCSKGIGKPLWWNRLQVRYRVRYISYVVTKSDEFVQSRRFICNTWLINIFQCLSFVIILKQGFKKHYNVLMEFPIALEIPWKYWVRLNDLNSVTSYLRLNWICRVLIGQSYLIAWVWSLAIAIAIGPLFVRSITKNYLCYLISGWSIFWLVEIIKLEQQCCHLLIGRVIIFSLLGRTVVKNRRWRVTQFVLFENVVLFITNFVTNQLFIF